MTDMYIVWQTSMTNRDHALYWLSGIGIMFVGSYLISYVPWLPIRWARLLRWGYEAGGALMFVAIIAMSWMAI